MWKGVASGKSLRSPAILSRELDWMISEDSSIWMISPSTTGEDNTLYKTLPQTLDLGQNACCIHSLAWVRKASQISVEPSRKPLPIQIWMGCMAELFHCSGGLAFPSCSSSCACILKIHYKALAKQQALRLWMLPLLCNSKNRSSGSNRIKGIRGNAH